MGNSDIDPLIQHLLDHNELMCGPEDRADLERSYWEAIETRDWTRFLHRCPKPHRVEVFAMLADKLTDAEYWRILRDVWEAVENQWQEKSRILRLTSAKRPRREVMMDADELVVFRAFGETVAVFRGHLPNRNLRGWSWTLNCQVAEWFAKRFALPSRLGAVAAGWAPRKHIVAYLNRRREQEVLVNPRHVKVLRKWVVTGSAPRPSD